MFVPGAGTFIGRDAMANLFALRAPTGEIWHWTLAETRRGVWENSFDSFPETFRTFYWKRFDASLAAAKRQGYKIVPVMIVECPRG